jgi:DNA-binding XRE family transcriptional regulator
LAVLRSIAGLTQGQLADLVKTSRPTIQAIELGKLTLSRRLAERISLQLHTGASMRWLLDGKYKVRPTCERDAHEPYSKVIFEQTRAEIDDPRTDPADRFLQFKIIGSVYWQLAAMFLRAYRTKNTVYFQHKLRFYLDDLGAQFPCAKDLPRSDDPKITSDDLWKLLENATVSKLRLAGKSDSNS